MKLDSGLDALKSSLTYNRFNESEVLIKDMSQYFPQIRNDLYYYYGYMLIRHQYFDQTTEIFDQVQGFENNKLFLNAYTCLNNNQINKSTSSLEKINNDFKYFNEAKEIKKMLISEPEYSYKYKTVSFLLSSIIPGSGQLYSGFTFDALSSFSYVATSGSAVYATWRYEFSKKESDRNYVLPAITSIGFTIFYITNLYNSVNVAEKANLFNQSQYYSKILDKFKLIIDDNKYFLKLNFDIE
ncbi:MAG: hypothetical protein JXR69_03330 [Candidatus Delongbacteria bacterium]|nr:hypothetical protein [Candidatus Delongbacteria bacterium]